MKISPSLPAFALVPLVLALTVSALVAAPKRMIREYRPLAAKAVRITVSSEGSRNPSAAVAFIREGWRFFDLALWNEAADRFLSGLEADPSEAAAGEGLAMALYRSGNHIDAAAVAEELARVMPEVKGMVAGALYEDVRELVDRGRFGEAVVLVSRFPASDVAYRAARELAGGAAAVETAMGAGTGAGGEVAAVSGD